MTKFQYTSPNKWRHLLCDYSSISNC